MVSGHDHGRHTMDSSRTTLIRRLTLQEIIAVNRSSAPFTARELEEIECLDLLSDVTFVMLLDEDDEDKED